MAKDPESEAQHSIGKEFMEYMSLKRRERLRGFKKRTEPAAQPEGESEKCEACERGDCDNPEHMDEGLAEELEQLTGGEEPTEDSPSDAPAPSAKPKDRKHAPDSDFW